MSEASLKRFVLYAACAAAAAALVYVFMHFLLVWLLPFLLAALAAAAIEPAVQYLQRRLRFRRSFSALVLTLFVLFVLGGLLSLLGTTLISEASALLAHLPALLNALPATFEALRRRVEEYSAACPPWMNRHIEFILTRSAAEAGGLLGTLTKRLPSLLAAIASALPRIFLGAATSVLAIYFTSSSIPRLQEIARVQFSADLRQKMLRFRSGMAQSLKRWLRAECLLCTVTFSELLIGFTLLRHPYALLLAFLITLVDALPVFGTGTVLIPWAFIELLLQNFPKSIALSMLYLLTLVVRNVLEPHLLGVQAGLPPVFSLLAMYVGFRAFGVAGMVLFPFFLLLFAQLRQERKAAER